MELFQLIRFQSLIVKRGYACRFWDRPPVYFAFAKKFLLGFVLQLFQVENNFDAMVSQLGLLAFIIWPSLSILSVKNLLPISASMMPTLCKCDSTARIWNVSSSAFLENILISSRRLKQTTTWPGIVLYPWCWYKHGDLRNSNNIHAYLYSPWSELKAVSSWFAFSLWNSKKPRSSSSMENNEASCIASMLYSTLRMA